MGKRTKLTMLTALILSGFALTACQNTSTNESASMVKEASSAKEASSMSKSSSNIAKSSMTAEENSGETSGAVDFDSLVNKVDELVKLNRPVMNKVWPEYNYNDHNFLIFHLDENYEVKDAKLLSVTENRNL